MCEGLSRPAVCGWNGSWRVVNVPWWVNHRNSVIKSLASCTSSMTSANVVSRRRKVFGTAVRSSGSVYAVWDSNRVYRMFWF